MKIHIAGENSLIIYFGEQASPEISAQVQQMTRALQQRDDLPLVDLIPSYASVLVIFDPLATDYLQVRKIIHAVASSASSINKQTDGTVVELPVWYSEESGPDLALLAERGKLSIDQIIDIHQEQEYRVYAIGFAPGFAYLGSVDERIAAPRLATPRQKVPRGAVAIADRQTAVYPAQSPGGWNLIGLCPTAMFDPGAEPTMPVQVGDRVRFRAIDREQFIALGGTIPEAIS